jgi:hypothetical protein
MPDTHTCRPLIGTAIRQQTARCLVALSVGQQSYNMLDNVLDVLRSAQAESDPDATAEERATLGRLISETERAMSGLRTALSQFPDAVWFSRARMGCDQPAGAMCLQALGAAPG